MNSVIFFGTDEYAVHILSVLLDNKVDVKAIVTKPDRVKNRNKKLLPPPVKEYYMVNGVDIPLFQPEKASTGEFAEVLRGFDPDLFVVVSYGEIISEELLAIPKLMPINIHPSLLPKYRGASPLRSALLNGDKETGVAIIEMVKAMDAGDIVKMEKMEIFPEDDHSSLQKRVFDVSGKVLLSCLEAFERGEVVKVPQEGSPTFTKKFSKDDMQIDWKQGFDKALCKIHAFGESPGAFCFVKVGEETLSLKITKAKKISSAENRGLETLSFSKNEGWLIAIDGGILQLLEVQLQNKKLMKVKDFINGMRGVAPGLLFS